MTHLDFFAIGYPCDGWFDSMIVAILKGLILVVYELLLLYADSQSKRKD
nr:MAG TPA: hypothetical protein [Caudoviricetes sp.]DAK81607.1 MAG TPA: hypothetical protein [Caudoviricetes sp.]